jgi:hypothetical protein
MTDLLRTYRIMLKDAGKGYGLVYVEAHRFKISSTGDLYLMRYEEDDEQEAWRDVGGAVRGEWICVTELEEKGDFDVFNYFPDTEKAQPQ